MPAADGVDARARRVAARLLATRARRSAARPEQVASSRTARRAVGGHPARAARLSRAVRALESEGWVALERVHRPGGGGHVIDQLIIGPGGIVVVDAQPWVGRIEVVRGVVQQNGFWREPECAEVARTAGSVAALLLPQHRTAVHAVICVAQHDLAHRRVAPGVHVVGVTGLARLLHSLPRRIHPAEILQLHTQLRHDLGGSAPPEQLTTAELDRLLGPGYLLAPDPLSPFSFLGQRLFVPLTGRSLRSVVRRGRPARGRAAIGWRLYGARLLLAVLVALGGVVLGPELLGRPSPMVPGQQIAPVAPLLPPPGASVTGPADDLIVFRPSERAVAPPAATAKEDHQRPPL